MFGGRRGRSRGIRRCFVRVLDSIVAPVLCVCIAMMMMPSDIDAMRRSSPHSLPQYVSGPDWLHGVSQVLHSSSQQ